MTKVINQLIEDHKVKVGRKSYEMSDGVAHVNELLDSIDLTQRKTFDQLCELGEWLLAFRALYPSDKEYGKWQKRSFPSLTRQRSWEARFCFEHRAKALKLFNSEKLSELSPNTIAKAIKEANLTPKEKAEREASKEAYKEAKASNSTDGKSVTKTPSKKKETKLTVKQYSEQVISGAKENGISLEMLIEQLSVVAQATKK
jgi:hypothetical protein